VGQQHVIADLVRLESILAERIDRALRSLENCHKNATMLYQQNRKTHSFNNISILYFPQRQQLFKQRITKCK